MCNRWGWDVQILVFIIGDRGLLDEDRWRSNWKNLNLEQKSFTPFCKGAIVAAQAAATDILTVYKGALLAYHAADGPRN